ncbi:MAG: hypothetical protein Q4F00_01875, partial [bacterium]|nr:hypothetical protein [bacterium]
PAAVPEPIPVTVKVNNSADSVSFDVNWSGDVKVKEFPYNPSKGMHTFVFSPAVLSAPEGLVAVSQGTLQAIRTRQLDKQTVAVDIMASSAPNVKAQNRQTPGASYAIRAAKAAAAVPKTPKPGTSAATPSSAKSTGEAKQPVTASNVSSKVGSTQPATATPAPVPAGQTEPQKASEPSPAAINSSQVPAAAPKATSNVGAESKTAAGQNSGVSDSERVCDYFTMAGRDVQSLVNSMKGLFPNVRFQADPVLSVILVEGPAKDIEEVRKLINIQ